MEWDDVLREISATNGAVTELRLSHLADLPGPPVVALGIELLGTSTGAQTVGDLVRSADVEEILRDVLPRGERRAFLRALPAAIRRVAAEAARSRAASTTGDRAPAAFDPDQVPQGGEALDVWAAHFGLEEALRRRVRVQIGPRKRDSLELSAVQCVDLTRHPQPGGQLAIDRQALRRPVEEQLRRLAAQNAPLIARRAEFLARRRAPGDAWIAERIHALTQLAQPRGLAPRAPLSLAYPLVSVAFHPDPITLVITDEQRCVHRVELESGALHNDGFYWHGSEQRAHQDAAILQCAIDALSDPEGKALSDLLAWRAVPAWRHMLDAFEGTARSLGAARRAGAGDPVEQLAFRFPPAVDDLPVVLVQKARKGGAGFTAGRQTDLSTARATPGLTPLEHEILDMLALLQPASPYRAGEHVQARLRLFELLAEHPRVLLAGEAGTAVRLRRVRAALRVIAVGCSSPLSGERADSAGAAFRVEIGVGAVSLPPADALRRCRGTGTLAALEPGDRVVSFAEVDDMSAALFGALAANPGELPDQGLDALLGVIATCPSMALDLDLPEQARGKPVAGDPRLVVQLSLAPDGGLTLALRARPLPAAPAVSPGAPPRHVFGTGPDGARIFATRDLDDEEARAERLLAELPIAGAARHGPFDVRIDDLDRACDVVATLAELGDQVVTEWPEGQKLRVASTLDRRSLKLRIARKRDWFGIEGGAELEGATIGIHALLEAVRAGRRFVRLQGGALVALGRDLRTRLARADDVLHDAQGGLAVHPPAVTAVCELVEDEDQQLAAAREWLELRARMRRAETFEPALPTGLTADLRPYQIEGYRWLMRLAECGAGACLADDMGLGKTLQSLAVLEARKALGPALVVAPMSVCSNWADEAARFAGDLVVVPYRGADRGERLKSLGPGVVLVTSYDLMLRDIDALESLELATAVFDEAHALKNGASKRSVAARRIRADFRVALSGTPIENHTGELWSLFRIVVPGLFGSWDRFRERFAAPIERDRDPARRAALASVVRPYLLRRTKREVAPELPARTEIVRFVVLSPVERELYEHERLRGVAAAESAGAGEDARFALLAALTRLRQLACHPRLRHPESTVASSKLASVVGLVGELREAGHRALVFSQFTSHLALVAEALAARGVTCLQLEGSTPADARADRVRRFQAGEADVFLISLKAGGVGLNLTAADYVLHLDPWWNPAAEDQASDRAHRIGQDKPVTVVRFIARATIEESVLALHAEKRELAEALLSGGDMAARLTTRQLVELMQSSAAAESADEGASVEAGDEE